MRTISLAIPPGKVGAPRCGRQHLQSRGVRIADQIHADPTDHRGVTVPSGLVSAQAARATARNPTSGPGAPHPDAIGNIQILALPQETQALTPPPHVIDAISDLDAELAAAR